ncbi:RNase adapter RapZ [Lysobacter pythonis]|uniref:RNase adapter RapZ n=1 Tax=Solilutibacter pythonis TaxID=2483112 RepID=A0A3M2I3F7_9GAMM|nr:RNase adapter RapZ [Lysobacter pythonis]RMH94119.1 RNase adapter RapZ [Lysobacter pythonis]
MTAPSPPPFVLLTGMSGSGKSIALKTLEDFGYYCIDNLPAELLTEAVRSLAEHEAGAPERLAVAIDVRSRSDLAHMPEWLSALGRLGHDPRLLFIDSGNEVLLRRYADTRRRHPLSHLGLVLADAIALERQALKPLRGLADAVIDSSSLNVHQLRRRMIDQLGIGEDTPPALLFESFAYKRGLPADADFVFDARVLPNPHWNPELRPLSGRDAAVREFLDAQPDVQKYLAQVREFLASWLPRLREETRSYITVAFGCSGGRHRSVYLAETLAVEYRDRNWPEATTFHRELE